MPYAVIAGFLYTLLLPFFLKMPRKLLGFACAILPLGLFIYFLSFYNDITNGYVISQSYDWIPSLGINFSFFLDGLSLTFSLIISFVGFAVFLYAGSYLKENKYIGRFYVYIMIFMASMLGVVSSDNLITLFVFWELTSISSYLLIGFNHDKERSRYAALQALLITGIGGLSMLAGFIIISNISGSYTISTLADLNELIINHNYYAAGVILILIGAFTKSAQFPFHFWLPNAMEAPTPVSAYLHSATMVKAGIYLMARLNPGLGGTDLWQNTILIIGAITMLFSAVLAFKQTDLKKLLAYSTLSVLGTLTMLIGIGTDLAIKAFMIYLIAHSLYKGALFLVAGSIDHGTGIRNIDNLGGLRKLMPITAMIAILASLSKMGIIPLIGFVGKETVYASVLESSNFSTMLIILTIAANVFVVFITISVGFQPFFGQLKNTPVKPHEAPFSMWFGPLVLGLTGLILGMFSSTVINNLINFTELGIITKKLDVPVKLWHGFTLEFGLSLLTVSFGLLLFWSRIKIKTLLPSLSFNQYLQPSFYYDILLNGTLRFAKSSVKLLQSGYLRFYIIWIIITTVIIMGYSLINFNDSIHFRISSNPSFTEIIITILMISSLYLAIRAKSRLVSIIAVGVIGYLVAIIFLMYSAPDLAMTQFAVETLTVIIFVLVIYKLPKFIPYYSTKRRIRDFIVAGSGGLLMALLALLIIFEPVTSELKKYFAENSLPLGKGRNIVNVILVDFRALDTLGEITVLAIAAIGVFALLKLRKNGDAG
jgi:multicomponent Na+:H+ antiporter subunit A